MKYFIKNSEVFAFEDDGSQDDLITEDFREMTAEEITQHLNPPHVLVLADFQRAHDAHINAPAIARRYDSFATFALRAGYPGPFHDEGVVFAQWMDACNIAGYAILAEVEAGARSVPASTDDYLALLPALPPELVLP